MSTTLKLISNIKLKGSFPSSDELFSNDDYLSVLDEEMLSRVVPLLNKANEEFFLTYKDYSIQANKADYRIPSRASVSILRDVQLISSNGSIKSLSRLFEEDKVSIDRNRQGYFIKGNQIILSPTPIASQGTLRLCYFRRPSKFVLPLACAQVTDINGMNVTVASLPNSMTNDVLVDQVQVASPYDVVAMDATIVGVSGNTLTLSEVSEDLNVNDWICLAGHTCVPMVPEEFIAILQQAALCSLLTSKKDAQATIEYQKLEKMEKALSDMLEPRVKSDDTKIINRRRW